MSRYTRHILIALAAVGCVAMVRCANKMTPTGGPKDTLPPRVVAANPAPGSRNFTAKRVTIEFDEYVKLENQSQEFFTSPFMETKPTLRLRDKTLIIDIKDTLAKDQTYALNFGTAVKDNNEGNVLYGMRYVFSTGASLDSMIMTGYTADAAKGDSVSKSFIYMYDAARDSIEYNDSLVWVVGSSVGDSLLLLGRPDVVGRAENNGIFIAQNLKDIDYKLYAVKDNNNNERYDPGVDKVGFLDDTFNPANPANPGFAMWLDEYRKYPTADPQVYFRMFSEMPKRRQNLVGTERPEQHKAILRFSSSFPQIDTLRFDSIPDDKVIREYLTAGRDTMQLWFDVPPEMLPDTIKGRIAYMKSDSIGNLVLTGQDIRLPWRLVETAEQEREREKEEREKKRAEEDGEEYTPPKKPNPFGFKVDATAELVPTKNIPIEFGLPLSAVDRARISLTSTTPARLNGGEEGKPVPVEFQLTQNDTTNIRKWILTADWNPDLSYNLLVPAGTFTNIAQQTNDTLKAAFKIAQRSKFATVNIDVKGKNPQARYIIEVLTGPSGDGATKPSTVAKIIPDAQTGKYVLEYIPEGVVAIRITEDGNSNGKWDTGNLVEHRQPERVENYTGPTGAETTPTRSNWEVDIALDMAKIFAPISIESVREDLQRAEDVRIMKYMEEQAAKDAQNGGHDHGTGSQNNGSLGIGSAMGGMRNQIQSTVR